MQLWVLKTNKLMDALKGAGGSVRTLALYPGPEPWVASVGLDRFLRIHDASTKASKARVYLKQQLTSVMWLPVQQPPAAAAAAGGSAEAAEAGGVPRSRERKNKKMSKSGCKHQQELSDAADEGDAAAEARHSTKRRKQRA
jgi:ribosome biogenesis protein NSA1